MPFRYEPNVVADPARDYKTHRLTRYPFLFHRFKRQLALYMHCRSYMVIRRLRARLLHGLITSKSPFQ